MDAETLDRMELHPSGGGGGARSEIGAHGIPNGKGVALGAAPFFLVRQHPETLQEKHHG
ncbi:hypothetical protein O9X98_07325 [Agrobacterium salinitolerans]|nr:hypothetical protein [Agrobacterium salinitolerans]